MSTTQRKHRAKPCDACRRRKVKCDSSPATGKSCSNCKVFKYECTFTDGQATAGYVRNLELQVQRLKETLNKLQAGSDSIGINHNLAFSNQAAGPSSLGGSTQNSRAVSPIFLDDSREGSSNRSDDGNARELLMANFNSITLDDEQHYFHGRSSSLMLLQTTLDIRDNASVRSSDTPMTILATHMSQVPHWNAHPWMDEEYPQSQFEFPELDLMLELVDLYFSEMNLIYPLLHRLSFVHSVSSDLHLRDDTFASILLLVCAIGARHSNDPRVLLPESNNDWHTVGWRYFRQVKVTRKHFNLSPPRIHDLQIAFLAAVYMSRTSRAYSSWPLVGDGIRRALDMGAHRRAVYASLPTHTGELLKRAFWCLIALDRVLCSVWGRPIILQEEDYDVDLPLEVDDEYWVTEDPRQAFQQPSGKPSHVAFFNCVIRLGHITAFALQAMHAVKKSSPFSVKPRSWGPDVIADVEDLLDKWLDSIPSHLRWDPNNSNLAFMEQSALLYNHYFMLLMAIHRPPMNMSGPPTASTLTSLTICNNAARACIRVMDQFAQKAGTTYYHHWQEGGLFSSALMLLLNIWVAKQTGVPVDPTKDMLEVHKCSAILSSMGQIWYMPGTHGRLLETLAAAGDLPLPPIPTRSPLGDPYTYRKPTRNILASTRDGEPLPGQIHTSNLGPSTPPFYNDISEAIWGFGMGESQQPPLPTSTEELRQLPMHAMLPTLGQGADALSWSLPSLSDTLSPDVFTGTSGAQSTYSFQQSDSGSDDPGSSQSSHYPQLSGPGIHGGLSQQNQGFEIPSQMSSVYPTSQSANDSANQEGGQSYGLWTPSTNTNSFAWDEWDSYTASISVMQSATNSGNNSHM